MAGLAAGPAPSRMTRSGHSGFSGGISECTPAKEARSGRDFRCKALDGSVSDDDERDSDQTTDQKQPILGHVQQNSGAAANQ